MTAAALAGSGALLALDVGGTDIKAALFDAAGTELAAATAPTPAGAPDPGAAVLEAAARLAGTLSGPAPAAVGLVVPGIVDEDSGTGVFSANLGWRDYPFRDRARERFGVPVRFGHDVGMAGEAEIAAAGPDGAPGDAAVVVIGTGIAAALFDGGHRLRGSGFAGEVGHLGVPHDGAWRPLESVASAAAIGRAYAERLGLPGPTPGSREVFEEAGLLGGPAGEHAAEAQTVLDGAFDALAFALLQVSTLLGTSHFVLTGGLARAGEALRAPLAARLSSAVTFHQPPTVALGLLGARAGLMGALRCARRAAEEAS